MSMQEAGDRIVNLENDDPELVARTLVYIYGQDYPVTFQEKSRFANSARKLLPGCSPDPKGGSKDANPLSIHAAVYGIADKYNCRSLKNTCEQAYVGQLSTQTSFRDFIHSVNIIYETTPVGDKGLRKWAVWFSQSYKEAIQIHPGFESLFRSRADFAWDYATNYQNIGRYWCEKCTKYAQPSQRECCCGASGMCKGGQACSASVPKCYTCSTTLKHWSVVTPDDDPRKHLTSFDVDRTLRNYSQKLKTT